MMNKKGRDNIMNEKIVNYTSTIASIFLIVLSIYLDTNADISFGKIASLCVLAVLLIVVNVRFEKEGDN